MAVLPPTKEAGVDMPNNASPNSASAQFSSRVSWWRGRTSGGVTDFGDPAETPLLARGYDAPHRRPRPVSLECSMARQMSLQPSSCSQKSRVVTGCFLHFHAPAPACIYSSSLPPPTVPPAFDTHTTQLTTPTTYTRQNSRLQHTHTSSPTNTLASAVHKASHTTP